MDQTLRTHPRYIGSFSPDLGNPLHRYLFIDMMFKDAFIRNGRVFVRADIEGEYNGLFFGADTFSDQGLAVLPYEEFDKTAPVFTLPKYLTARGLVTDIRLKHRMSQNIHERILSGLNLSGSLRKINEPFEWDLAQLPDSIEEVEVQARKLTDYLLNPNHKDGKSKAKFFESELGITHKDWAYLHSQLVDGLKNVSYENVRLDKHGIRFKSILPIIGHNGATVTIETGWIVRPGERASFVTAFPAKKDDHLETQVIQPPVIPDNLKRDVRWQKIYDLANEVASKAMKACAPKPLVVEGQVIMEGRCGGAYVVIEDGRSSFACWLRKKD